MRHVEARDAMQQVMAMQAEAELEASLKLSQPAEQNGR